MVQWLCCGYMVNNLSCLGSLAGHGTRELGRWVGVYQLSPWYLVTTQVFRKSLSVFRAKLPARKDSLNTSENSSSQQGKGEGLSCRGHWQSHRDVGAPDTYREEGQRCCWTSILQCMGLEWSSSPHQQYPGWESLSWRSVGETASAWNFCGQMHLKKCCIMHTPFQDL